MESDTVDSRPIGNKSNYLVRLYSGDISLPITYWVYGALIGNVGFQIVFKVIELNFTDLVISEIDFWFLMGFSWLAIGYNLFMIIAIWRSAGKYQGKVMWASLARLAVVIGTLFLVVNFVNDLQQGSDTDLALREVVETINKSLPRMVDNETRLDYVSVIDRDFYYDYTLVNSSVERMDISRFTTIMSEKIKTSQCEDEEALKILNEGRKIIFMYYDQNDEPVSKIVVEKADCL